MKLHLPSILANAREELTKPQQKRKESMIAITSANQIKLNSGLCIDATVSDRELGIHALVGYHHYTQISVIDARIRVYDALHRAGLDGWTAGCATDYQLPAGAIRVGQVRVHSHDCEYPLYVVQRTGVE